MTGVLLCFTGFRFPKNRSPVFWNLSKKDERKLGSTFRPPIHGTPQNEFQCNPSFKQLDTQTEWSG